MNEQTQPRPEAATENPSALRAVAELLYDELTGRHTAGKIARNAVLRPVLFNTREAKSERDRAIQVLHHEASLLGLELHYRCGDRWDLAQRLAVKVVATVHAHTT